MDRKKNSLNKCSAFWIKKQQNKIKKIEENREHIKYLPREELREKTLSLMERAQGGESLDRLLPEAFALVCVASARVTGLEPFPVQLLGGIALHEGKIAEMKTGEGKTLVAAFPAFLNALTGKGVHVVTVNDYLAKRDAESIGKIHEYLGLSVGVVLSGGNAYEKKKAYGCDITYVTNTELGFDYLRDNMVSRAGNEVQCGLNYAIIDEADSILIDEARTPLIISGEGEDVSKLYMACDNLAKMMVRGSMEKEFNRMEAVLGEESVEDGDFLVHEKDRIVTLTAQGIGKIENYFNLTCYADPANLPIQHAMDLALRANYLMKRDKDYIVRNGEVLIVDTFTGRIMQGRQYADGLHQAIEAKEHVPVRKETRTVATTTYQHFFRKYGKICGMTGTAWTERREFRNTYHLHTVVIPTNKPMIRDDRPDRIYLTKKGKYAGIIEEIKASMEKGQPVLVGTASVKTSEELDGLLTSAGIRHRVLNAKQDKEEADIIAQAGKHGAVTIATNMAGRGTDIILDQMAKDAGGLKVIGSERHESRRIDNQLRGRAGRQGDPGESVFCLSMDDDMVRLFSPERVMAVLRSGGFSETEEIKSRMFGSAVRKAQKKVEDNHFGMRKNVMDYDRILDVQREMVYRERRKLLEECDWAGLLECCISKVAEILATKYVYVPDPDANPVKDLAVLCKDKDCKDRLDITSMGKAFTTKAHLRRTNRVKIAARAMEDYMQERADAASMAYGSMNEDYIRAAVLNAMDSAWTEQLRALEYLRQDISFMGYGQKDPKSVYAVEAHRLFGTMKEDIYLSAVYMYFNMMPEPVISARLKTDNGMGQEKRRKAC